MKSHICKMKDVFGGIARYKHKNKLLQVKGIPWIDYIVDSNDIQTRRERYRSYGFFDLSERIRYHIDSYEQKVPRGELLYIWFANRALVLDDTVVNAYITKKWKRIGIRK